MNRSKKVIINIYTLVLMLTSIVLAQTNFTSETISIKDGLSSNIIRDIIQDQYGYMWITTAEGLNIYDGYKIKTLKNNPEDSTSLPSNVTYRILEDKHGTIWVTTDEGLARYNRENNNFTNFKHTESNNPLANWTVHIFEDSKDNLWIMAHDGVILFNRDTQLFERFDVMMIDNSVAVFVNNGGTIVESSSGDLYCTSQSFGLLKFDYKAKLFVQVPLKNDGNSKIIMQRYYSIAADSHNNLWFGNSNGLWKVDLNNNEIYDVTPFNKIKALRVFVDNAVTSLFIQNDQNMWVGTGRNGLFKYDLNEQKLEQLQLPITANFYMGLFEDESGILWVGSSRGVSKFDFARKPFVTHTLNVEGDDESRKEIYSFSKSVTNKNKVWLSTIKGLYMFDNRTNKIFRASSKYQHFSKFDDEEIFTVLEEPGGFLWLATARSGLYSYNLFSGQLKNYQHKIYNNSSISNNTVHNLALDNEGKLWVATHEGLNFLKKGTEKFVSIPSFMNRRYDDKLVGQIKRLRNTATPASSIINVGDDANMSKEFVLRNNAKVIIHSIGEGLTQWGMVDFGWLESENGDTLWNGGIFDQSFHASGGLKNRMMIGLLDLKAGRYKLKYKSDDSHSVESYNSKPPQDSSYWGTQLFVLSNDEYNNSNILLEKSNEMSYLNNEDIKVIFCDSKNNVWIGTDGGLAHIDSNLIIKNYVYSSSNKNSLSNNFIRDIKKDLYNNLWIATANGLNRLEVENEKFTVIREKDGLPSSNISAIEVDNKGDLWVSSQKGISKIELDDNGNTQFVVNYDVKDGLQGYQFIQSSSYKDETGKMFFGGIDGFNAFYPGSSNRTPPFISIQNIKISNKSIKGLDEFEDPNLTELSEISLSHNQNDLSFEFASIHFSRPDKNRLLYKLEGADDDWQVGDRRFASYTNLDPGDYVFYLKGSNGDGVWSDNTRKINIHIDAPWYNNWTAYAVYAFLFFGLLFSVRKFEITRQQKNAKIIESQLQLEAAELKATAAEAQALVVQAENERKTKELEEARQLQLSMLPKELPQLPHLDIAVYMKTATEVGGDYYDFNIGLDGTLTVVLGDATGHGMKAGTMVTTTKSLFNVLAPNPNIVETFHEMTRCLKLMHLEKLSMCMTMIKIMGNKIQMSAAGMPPIFIYKKENQSIEEHVMKGMPLGTFSDFPYTLIESEISTGDTILMMSDGFPELMNDEKEMFGYKQARNLFEEISGESPENIITKLKNAGSEWTNDADPDDDVTFVVIKVK